MKITLVNASPKAGANNSGYFAKELEGVLDGAQVHALRVNKPLVSGEEMEALLGCDALVLCFPLYVDQLPSHLLRVLMKMEEQAKGRGALPCVYAVANCGFHEGIQNELVMQVLENWCSRAGFSWKRGLGIGCGEMLGGLEGVPLGSGPKKTLGIHLRELAADICAKRGGENRYISADFPRWLYKVMANMSWGQMAKENGLKKKDLFRIAR